MSLMGVRHIEMCERLVKIYDLPVTPEEYSKMQKEVNSEIMKHAHLLPGNFLNITTELISFVFLFLFSLCLFFPFLWFVYFVSKSGLSDTEPVYEEVIRQIAQTYNKTYPIEVRLKLLGTTEPRTAEIAVTDLGLPITPQEFLEKFHVLCRKLLANCPMKPG